MGKKDVYTKDKKLLSLIPDYKINLLAPLELEDDEIERFQTDLREVMYFIKYSKDKKKLMEILQKNPTYRSMDIKAARVVNAVTDIGIKMDEKEERVNMCKGMQDLLEDARNEGREEVRQSMCQGMKDLLEDARNEGREEVRQSMCQEMQDLLEDARKEEREEIRKNMYQEMQDLLEDARNEVREEVKEQLEAAKSKTKEMEAELEEYRKRFGKI